MKKICYFECFAGASGDMLLAALLGTFTDYEKIKDYLIGELDKIADIKGTYKLNFSKVLKNGISAYDVDVQLLQHEHHHRGLAEITRIINSSAGEEKAKNLSIAIFTNLAKAEAKVHDIDIEKIHFHEVGAIDAIIDIVGFSILFASLNIDKVIVSSVNVGSGFVKAAHGVLPVPAPATLELINSASWSIDNSINIESESLTPTGAAILTTIKDSFGTFPAFSKINSVSYGAGKRDFKNIANVLRLTTGEINDNVNLNDRIIIIETNIDDMQPEFYNYIFDKLFQSGALDVYLTPIIMKKTRPANILTVLCTQEDKENLKKIILQETTTFGIRSYSAERTVLNREFKKIFLENLGEINLKIAKDLSGKILSIKPEYEDCAKIAKEKNIPLKEIYNLLVSTYRI